MAGTMGVNVYKMQYLCVMASGMLAAIGGAYLSIGDINMFSKDMVSGRGYIALSMVILGNWKPLWVALGGLVYGFAQASSSDCRESTFLPSWYRCCPIY